MGPDKEQGDYVRGHYNSPDKIEGKKNWVEGHACGRIPRNILRLDVGLKDELKVILDEWHRALSWY